MPVNRNLRAILLALCLLPVVGRPAVAAPPGDLWRIGVEDNDDREFAIAGQYGEFVRRFPRDVTFRVGQDRPEQAWPFIQPGPTDAWAGGRAHTFRVVFDLAEVPPGACRLRVDLVNTHYSMPPTLEIAVNGRARYRFALPAGGPDAALTDPKAGRETTLALPFPSRHLRPGRNEITLTTVVGSWLLYDALRLETGAQVPQQPEVATVEARSTMLFKRVGGALRQAMRVTVNNTGIEGPAEVRLSGAREHAETAALLPGGNTFHLLVTPFERPEKLRLLVRAGGAEKTVEFEGRPERKWTVYAAPSTHTDIGYTDFQERVFERHAQNTQDAVRAAERDPAFKWNLEVGYQAPLFRARRPADFPALVRLMRRGQVGLQGLYLNMLTGICSGEELMRALEWPQETGRALGVPVVSAHLTDVPSSVGTMPMLLRHAGVRYFAEAVNQYRGPLFRYADPRLPQAPFWWEGLDGSRVLAIFTHGYGQVSGIGLAHSVETTAQRLPDWLRGFDRPTYPYDTVFAYGAFGDNERMEPRYAEVARAWNREWEYPKIVVSRVDEFFRDVETRYGPALPVFRGDFGSFWEDGAASSARETAMVRWAKARLEGAERRFALGAAQGASYPAADLRAAWNDVVFFDEHTWGAAQSISQPKSAPTKEQWAYKAAYAVRAAKRAEKLGRRLTTYDLRLATVYNDLSWPRDVTASVPVPAGWGTARVHEARPGGSASGRLVPCQRSGGRLVFVAEQVPAHGWRAYRLERGAPPARPPLLRRGADDWTWETAGFRLRFDPQTGAIASLVEKHTGDEWVKPGGYGLNQFLYAVGGEGSRLIQPDAPEPKLDVRTHARTTLAVVENGPARAALRLERRGGDAPPCDTWIVFGPGGRLDLVNVLHKEATLAKEAGYFAFPFHMRDEKATKGYVELPYGVLQADREQIAGACREWYAAHSFAAVSDGRRTAVLATPHAPLLTFNDLFRGQWRTSLGPLNGALFGYVFNNYWDTNYKASQGGDMVFAFSLRLTSGGFDPAAATRFGWERLADMPDPRAGARLDVWEEGAIRAARPGASGAPVGSRLRVTGGTALVGGAAWEKGRLRLRLYNPAWTPTRAVLEMPGAKQVTVPVPARGVVTRTLALSRRL